MVAHDPHPGREASAEDLYDWHLARSLSESIPLEDAEVLADSYVYRVLTRRGR